MRLGMGLLVYMSCYFGFVASSFAAFEDESRVEAFQYASDYNPTFQLANKSVFETEHFLAGTALFYESGTKGVFSFDPDPLRYSFFASEAHETLFWFGREHPANMTREGLVDPYSALGTISPQNQLDALNPRVSGWVGAGVVQNINAEWKLTAAYSPLFLPSFGPSLGFTDRGELTPSRFARLPPAQAVTGGITVPIRYQLKLSQLSELLLQHQVYLGLTQKNEISNFELYAFTAPKPDPVPITDAKLAVSASDVNAKVYINPQFPREYWAGSRLQLKAILFQPALEAVQSLTDFSTRLFSLTGFLGQARPASSLLATRKSRSSFGILSHFKSTSTAPVLSDFLVFVKIPFEWTENLHFQTRLEATLYSLRESVYWLNELEYQVSSQFTVFSSLNLLSGRDHSYFGDWRDQDSVSMGIKYLW